MRWQGNVRENRKARQDLSAFDSAIRNPVAGILTLPANAHLYVRNASALGAVTEALSVRDRTLSVPALRAGQVYELGFFERGTQVEVLNGLELLITTGLGRYAVVALTGV